MSDDDQDYHQGFQQDRHEQFVSSSDDNFQEQEQRQPPKKNLMMPSKTKGSIPSFNPGYKIDVSSSKTNKPMFGGSKTSDKPMFGSSKTSDKPMFGGSKTSDKPKASASSFISSHSASKPSLGGLNTLKEQFSGITSDQFNELIKAIKECKPSSGLLGDDYKEMIESVRKSDDKFADALLTSTNANGKAMAKLFEDFSNYMTDCISEIIRNHDESIEKIINALDKKEEAPAKPLFVKETFVDMIDVLDKKISDDESIAFSISVGDTTFNTLREFAIVHLEASEE